MEVIMEKITVNQFHTNYMKMYNLLREVECSFPEGVQRQEAYNLVGTGFGHPIGTLKFLI